jgi:glucose-6-phosphate 1-epimerase
VREWTLHDVLGDEGSVTATFVLAEERAFELLYAVTVGQTLGLSLRVSNRSAAPMTFEEALHTYLAVSDVRAVVVEGLSGREYIDKVDGMKRKTQSGPVTIAGETDRVYLNTPDTVTVHDGGAGRRPDRGEGRLRLHGRVEPVGGKGEEAPRLRRRRVAAHALSSRPPTSRKTP